MRRTMILTWILVGLYGLSMAPPAHSQYHSKTLPCDHPEALKVTNLHFFLHETRGRGKIDTAVEVARAINVTSNNNSLVPFGSVAVLDDPLKLGPDDDSEVIGNAQGLVVSPSRSGTTLVMYLDYGFVKGKFKGSSISMFSRVPVMDKVRELSVVGGRGKFKMAKGFALLNTYVLTNTTLVVEYNVTVIHY